MNILWIIFWDRTSQECSNMACMATYLVLKIEPLSKVKQVLPNTICANERLIYKIAFSKSLWCWHEQQRHTYLVESFRRIFTLIRVKFIIPRCVKYISSKKPNNTIFPLMVFSYSGIYTSGIHCFVGQIKILLYSGVRSANNQPHCLYSLVTLLFHCFCSKFVCFNRIV